MPVSSKLIQMSASFVNDDRYRQILKKARDTYGDTAQILVSTEELCELAAVCAKYPRYTDPEKARSELCSAAIDEVADVIIVLDHVINIFGLSDWDIQNRIKGKIGRIQRWLSESDSQEQTTVDRAVEEKNSPCSGCKHVGNFQNLKPGHRCVVCSSKGFSLKEPCSGSHTVKHQADMEDSHE